VNKDCVFARLRLAETRQPFTNGIWITPAIQDSPYSHRLAFLIVIDGVGETLGQQPMIPELFGMNSRVKSERFDVGKQRFQKIVSHTFFLPFIKVEAVGKIIPRRRQNDDAHFALVRSCFFAVSQSMKDSLPCLTRAALSRRTSPCHSGDLNCASSRVKSLHSVSITRSFSATVICSNGSVISIPFSIRLFGDGRKLGLSLPRVQAGRDTWSLSAAFGEVVFQRAIMQWLAAGAFKPGHILGVLHALQKFFVLLYWNDHRNGFALARYNFGFRHGRFHIPNMHRRKELSKPQSANKGGL
jgi:hypothetical protein